jgi:hypothetical protein
MKQPKANGAASGEDSLDRVNQLLVAIVDEYRGWPLFRRFPDFCGQAVKDKFEDGAR